MAKPKIWMWHSHIACLLLFLPSCALQPQANPMPPWTEAATQVFVRVEQQVELAQTKVKEAAIGPARDAVQSAWHLVDAHLRSWLADPKVQKTLLALGGAAWYAQDPQTAHDAWSEVERYRARALPEDHLDVQAARGNLAVVKRELGDLGGALALEERVLEVRTRTLPPDHPHLVLARQNVAVTKKEMGDLRGALALEDQVLEARARTLPDDHPDLQMARQNLSITRARLGDLHGAVPLAEKVLAVRSHLPDEHPDLQAARQNLAAIKHDLGDLHGALVLHESVLAARERTLPEDHPDLQSARQNLATALHALGDLHGAAALFENVFAVYARTLPADNPHLLHARQNLSIVKRELGDLGAALEIEEQLLAKFASELHGDHPDLQTVRQNLATTKSTLGDLAGALTLQQDLVGARERMLPDDHPDLASARRDLLWTLAALGDSESALPRARRLALGVRSAVARTSLAPRELAAAAAQARASVDALCSLTAGCGTLPPQRAVAEDTLLLVESLRGVESRATRLLRLCMPAASRAEADALSREVTAAVDRMMIVAREAVVGEGEAREASLRARDARRLAAVGEKDRLQRRLASLIEAAGGLRAEQVSARGLAAALPERSAAVSIAGYLHVTFTVDKPGEHKLERRLLAFILHPRRGVTTVSLGAETDTTDLVARLRNAAGAGESSRGRQADGADTRRASVDEAGIALRSRVVDPILAQLPDVDTVYLSVAEELQLVPLDALPIEGSLVGDRMHLRALVSLFDLLESPIAAKETHALVAFGGIDYAATATDQLARESVDGGYAPLPGARAEVAALAEAFEGSTPGAEAIVRADDRATKVALFELAPRARYLHVATHGFFIPEDTESIGGGSEQRALATARGTSALSPLALCGLALAGANLPAGATGTRVGIATAEELIQLDLSGCALAVLSACDTSIGVRRAGQGYASLRAALHGAGAKHVLTSLWKVGDTATRDLMTDFYRRLWRTSIDPHRALWQARMEARRQGAPFRDFAGWVLVGK